MMLEIDFGLKAQVAFEAIWLMRWETMGTKEAPLKSI